MKLDQNNIRLKLNMIIIMFLLINIIGIIYVLKNFSLSIIYQQISSLIFVFIIWVLLLLIIYRIFLVYLYRPIKKIARVLKLASEGDLSEKANYVSNDELGQIANSIDSIIQNQSNLSEFLEKIGDGNFNIEYAVLSEKDKLGYSIAGMRNKLHKLVSDDAKRQWSTEGIARFGAILRENNDDIKVVCDKLLSDLVKYLNANQGAIFLLHAEKKEKTNLEMVSAYAWERKKYITKTIELGEGLVGQAAIEKGTIYLTDVPDNYINITSGLGDANPRSILIVPLLFNDELFGIMEFASFKTYESYEISFVEKLAEIVGSTISRANINKQTQKLLSDSQKLTEELRTQEEEMRQNIEEMNATQEEMQQREVERIGIFTAINNTLATIEFGMDGRIINANDKYLKMMDYTLDEIESKTDRTFSDKANEPIEVYNEFWKQLREGKVQNGDYKRITKNGREIWINASYTPALNKDGLPYKVIALATDITEKKNAELETRRQAEELRLQGEKLKTYTNELEDIKKNLSEKLNEASLGLKKKIQDIEMEKSKNIAILEGCVDAVISFDHTGKIEYFNTAAEETWGIQRDNVLGKKISSIIPLTLEQSNGSLAAYSVNEGGKKAVDLRTEISWIDKDGKDYDLLVTLTRAKVDKNETFTIFAQKISVDIF
jgi:PAS domain S-box-containing protein